MVGCEGETDNFLTTFRSDPVTSLFLSLSLRSPFYSDSEAHLSTNQRRDRWPIGGEIEASPDPRDVSGGETQKPFLEEAGARRRFKTRKRSSSTLAFALFLKEMR